MNNTFLKSYQEKKKNLESLKSFKPILEEGWRFMKELKLDELAPENTEFLEFRVVVIKNSEKKERILLSKKKEIN